MRKLFTLLSLTFVISLIAPSCASDENFDDISKEIQLDQTAPTTGGPGDGDDSSSGSGTDIPPSNGDL